MRTVQAPAVAADDDEAHPHAEPLQNGVPGLPAIGGRLCVPPLQSSDQGRPSPLSDETTRWGRDDLKRHEMGSQGHEANTGVGRGLGHLTGLGDEELGRRNGETIVHSDNRLFAGDQTDVGSGLDHLWLLGDFEYARSSTDDPEDRVFHTFGQAATAYGPLAPDAFAFRSIEDMPFRGRIFDPSEAILPVVDRTITLDPSIGQVVFNSDGTFAFTPVGGYSGVATIGFTFTDPRTGLPTSGTITLTVAAVADAPTISGAAATPEDTRVATPITVTLNDTDGSEIIAGVVITGLPSGAVLAWDPNLGGAVTQRPDGSFAVTGSTAAIQALLASLTVKPPVDFNGRITLDVAVTIIEANVDPALPGYRDQQTVHYPYRIDVAAVADPVTATGDTKTTDEDVAVHLDLAATFGDRLDGSETHTIEIRGVPSGARLRDAQGNEYPVTIAVDGTRTYALTPAQVGNVYFLPPVDASGQFTGMSIVATAVEASNGSTATASAPISVTVNPVADPVSITARSLSVNEDTAITFGDDISIVVNDPASQTLTRVVVTGFPAGTTITYTPVGGGAAVTVVAGSATSITFSGGTQQQIRDALATLALTPPLHTDRNISLSVSATTVDVGGVSDTKTVPMSIAVAAVADGPTISGSASGNEDQPIALPITVSRIDADGSEQYEFAALTIPSGATLIYPTSLPNGITVAISGTTYTFSPGSGTTAAQFQAFLATGLQVRAPTDSDVNFNVSVRVGTIESVLSGGEVTLLRDTETVAVPVTVRPVVDLPTITGASGVDEDRSVNFGANIAVTSNDRTDGSEAITRIVLGNIPATAAVTYTAQGGTSVVASTVAGITTYTISGGTESNIRATLATFSLQPALNSDANIAVSVALTKVDGTTSDAEGTVTSTMTATHNITVAAVADGPTISGSAAGLEDQPISLPITVTRIDADGSEQYDFAAITVPTGVSLVYPGVLPSGITVAITGTTYTFTPGAATTAAQFQTFLATGLQVRAPADSDVNFNVTVRVGTIESVPTDAGMTLLRSNTAITVPVTVSPVIDAPVITGSSSVNEDGIVNPADQTVTSAVNFGANISISNTDRTDGSEAITRIVVSGLPIGAVVTYTPIGGSPTTFTVAAGTTSITLTGASEAAIRTALATLSLVPPPHQDADIPLTIQVTKTDATTSEAEPAVSQVFSATHVIRVAAIADVPTISGSATGLEDQSIPLAINVAHPDSADGSETIKQVVIEDVPTGFTLTESSVLAGVLVNNGGGRYTVTGPTDAAIKDLLTHLTLAYAGGPRVNLDTDFSLSVTATTIESTPSETGTGQMGQLETSNTVLVPITVTAVVDGVNTTGASVLVEDVPKTIGTAMQWSHIDTDGSEIVTGVVVSGFPAGATVTYTDLLGVSHTFTATGAETVSFSGPHVTATETAIRAALDTLAVTAPPHSDTNFSLTIGITTTDNDASATTQSFSHTVVVQAVADAPSVGADNISISEDGTAALVIRPDRSADTDNSETLSVRITVPSDGSGAIGMITGSAPGGVTFTSLGGGVYTVSAVGATAAIREAALDGFLNGGLTFTPRAQWSGVLTGTNGIRVDVTSTEGATLYGNTTPAPDDELAPNNSAAAGTSGDPDTRVETATTYIDVRVAPVNDLPVLANAATIVQENTNSTAASDPDLIIPIGTRLGLTIADTDGSQGLSMTLTGFPVDAQALAFGTSLAGVTTSVDIATGTVTISGANANNVLTVLASLSVTFADDRDQNFTVAINGTSSDTNGVTTSNTAFALTHNVTVQAVADVPTVDVGAATKPAVSEDSGFVTYPVTTALGDTDGSETYQSIVIQFSTPGSGAPPVLQFGTTAGVSFVSAAGSVTLNGSAAAINAAMATLQVRPGADNGEDITIRVTATSVESAPAEDNDGVTPGMGGGIAGPEISIPTAQTVATFVIPVDPVPEVPSLTLPASASGTEDTSFPLGAITVSSGTADPDNSETLFIEIATSSYPSGTTFTNGGTAVGSIVTAGWIRIPSTALATLNINPPHDYSGSIVLDVRGVIVDTTTSGSVTATTAVSTLPVTVTPDADPVTAPASTSGVEDNGAVAFGAALASTATGIRVTDAGTGTGNNTATETLTRVVLDFPADTATQTYSIVAGTAVGSASVVFDAGTRAYTITSSLLTGDLSLVSPTDRAQAETDIRATLAGFTATMGPTHTDLNGIVAVTATTLDVNGTVANTQDTTFNHTIQILAVADTPSIAVVAAPGSVAEDAGNITLSINAGNSADTDNSETLSVRITVPSDALGPVGTIVGSPPAGVTLTSQGGGVYLVTASGATNAIREAALDGFLNGGGISFDPRTNWSGSLTGTNGLRVDAISTEGAVPAEIAPGSFGGADGTSATETVTSYIDLVVSPVADTPTVKGNGVGLEDTVIPIPMSVTLGDKDGTETYVVRITGGVPSGAHIYGAGGAEITPQVGGPYNGQYILTPADVAALAIRPPLNTSSPLQGDITLAIATDVTDNSGVSSTTTSFSANIVVEVKGVADQPGTRTVDVSATEDQPIGIGAAIVASAGGNLNNLLADTDTSEQLSFVFSGIPAGVVPTSAVAGGVTYIGDGNWSVTAAAMATLQLPAVTNFSGDNPYSGVSVRAVTQEVDGDQAVSASWPVTIHVAPLVGAPAGDGYTSWSMGATVTEATNEGTGGVSLASAANMVLVDNDGSERIVSYTFNLSTLIADAQIAAQLAGLAGTGVGLDKLVANYISGTFTYDAGAGTITVLASNIAGVVLSGSLFTDSNKDFSIPVSALVRDTAVLNGVTTTADIVETGTLAVDLVGTADTPTAVAVGNNGFSGTPIPITLGGVSTDDDVALGRAASESIFYVVRTTNWGTAPIFGLVNGSGQIVGLDLGGGSFMLTTAEIGDVRVVTPPGVGGTISLELTTVATENDGNRAVNTATLDVVVTPVTGSGGGTAPLPPTVVVGASNGNEDGSITLNVTATPAAGDLTNPTVSVLISGIPSGARVVGATLLPPVNAGDPPRWVASAAAINSGNVSIIPPADFSGDMGITIEGFARNANLQSASTGPQPLTVKVDPVADGVAITASPAAGNEDAPIALNISLAERDVDGSEDIGGFVYVSLTNGATLLGGYALVGAGDSDASIDGTSLVGYYRVPTGSVATLQAQAAPNWHGSIGVTVAAYAQEPVDPTPDPDNMQLDTKTFSVAVAAVADPPTVTGPATLSGTEDSSIALTGLSAALVDTVTSNGAEVLSVLISGIPHGSLLSAGSNNGDGSWTIPVAALAALTITPPLNYAGTMSLTIKAIALELANGSEAASSVTFDVVVAPRADGVEILANNVTVGSAGEATLPLNVRMADDNGTNTGELPPEQIRITFSGVPSGVSIIAEGGGTVTSLGGGSWQFLGSEDQSNALRASVGPGASAGTYMIGLSAVTIDGASTLATPVTDNFQLTVPQVMTGTASGETLTGGAGTQLMFGQGGADTINGGIGNDFIVGGTGADALTGGGGSDTFAWRGGEPGTGVDTIADFTPGAGGDVLDVSALLTGFNPASSPLAGFVRLTAAGANTNVEVDADGGANSFQVVAVLQGVTGVDAAMLQTNGNLIV